MGARVIAGLRHDLDRAIGGEARVDAATRAMYSADASNHRRVPIAVVDPRDAADVEAALTVCREHDVPVLPLGARTSIAGLAGNIGFERGHHAVSMACAVRVLLPAVRAAGPGVDVLADLFSCRTQLRQTGPREPSPRSGRRAGTRPGAANGAGGTLVAEVHEMVLEVASEPVPLLTDPDGVVRIGSSRVTLASLVAAFRTGATAEQIVHKYPSVDLAEVYAAVAYYLRHRADVDAYLRAHEADEQAAREAAEERFDPTGIRDRLLARRHG